MPEHNDYNEYKDYYLTLLSSWGHVKKALGLPPITDDATVVKAVEKLVEEQRLVITPIQLKKIQDQMTKDFAENLAEAINNAFS